MASCRILAGFVPGVGCPSTSSSVSQKVRSSSSRDTGQLHSPLHPHPSRADSTSPRAPFANSCRAVWARCAISTAERARSEQHPAGLELAKVCEARRKRDDKARHHRVFLFRVLVPGEELSRSVHEHALELGLEMRCCVQAQVRTQRVQHRTQRALKLPVVEVHVAQRYLGLLLEGRPGRRWTDSRVKEG